MSTVYGLVRQTYKDLQITYKMDVLESRHIPHKKYIVGQTRPAIRIYTNYTKYIGSMGLRNGKTDIQKGVLFVYTSLGRM